MHKIMRRSLFTIAMFAATLPLSAQLTQSDFRARRAALASSVGDGAIVAFGGGEPEQDYLSFYQRPRFAYLTGFMEPDAALVIVKRGAQVREMMFVMPRDPAREVWTGSRPGLEGVQRLTGVETRDMRALRPTLDTLLATGTSLHVVGAYSPERQLASEDDIFVRALREKFPKAVVVSVNDNVDLQRRVKNATELDLLRKSIAITVAAQREAMRAIRPGMNEFEIQSLVEYTFRRNGADRTSFATIIGSGPNSTTLHYNADNRFMKDGEVVVMDIGASYRGYAADVTRTIPVNGVFSPAQREIYQAVRDAQSAAERAATFGAPAQRMIDASLVSLKASLARLGLIESPDATYECGAAGITCPQYRLYYMHGLGHGIGLEVHDPWYDTPADKLTPGHAFTIEPGIYVRANILDIISDTPRNREIKEKVRAAVARYANIGVRIEDDYIVTANAVEWISRAPREIPEIEALMRDKSNGPAARDAATVEWYRATTPREPGGL